MQLCGYCGYQDDVCKCTCRRTKVTHVKGVGVEQLAASGLGIESLLSSLILALGIQQFCAVPLLFQRCDMRLGTLQIYRVFPK